MAQIFLKYCCLCVTFQHDLLSDMGQYKCAFTPQQEHEYVHSMKSRLFCLVARDPIKLAYQLARKNNLPRGLKTEDK
jgi:hypothetical protein